MYELSADEILLECPSYLSWSSKSPTIMGSVLFQSVSYARCGNHLSVYHRLRIDPHNMDLVQATQLSTTHNLLDVLTTLRALAFAKIEENDTNRQVPLGSTSQGRHMN